MDMVKLVLDNNTFQFQGQHYVQTEGTAIGSKLGRNYACTCEKQTTERVQQTQSDWLPRVKDS